MKRKFISNILISLFLLAFVPSAYSKDTIPIDNDSAPFEVGVSFDWISKTQLQRDENIKHVQDILFSNTTVIKYPKQEFKAKYAEYWKDKNSLTNYEEITNGKKFDNDKNYCGFFVHKLLIA